MDINWLRCAGAEEVATTLVRRRERGLSGADALLQAGSAAAVERATQACSIPSTDTDGCGRETRVGWNGHEAAEGPAQVKLLEKVLQQSLVQRKQVLRAMARGKPRIVDGRQGMGSTPPCSNIKWCTALEGKACGTMRS